MTKRYLVTEEQLDFWTKGERDVTADCIRTCPLPADAVPLTREQVVNLTEGMDPHDKWDWQAFHDNLDELFGKQEGT